MGLILQKFAMDKAARSNDVFESKDPRYINMKQLEEEELKNLRQTDKSDQEAWDKKYPRKFREEIKRQAQEAKDFYKRMGYDTLI